MLIPLNKVTTSLFALDIEGKPGPTYHIELFIKGICIASLASDAHTPQWRIEELKISEDTMVYEVHYRTEFKIKGTDYLEVVESK